MFCREVVGKPCVQSVSVTLFLPLSDNDGRFAPLLRNTSRKQMAVF